MNFFSRELQPNVICISLVNLIVVSLRSKIGPKNCNSWCLIGLPPHAKNEASSKVIISEKGLEVSSQKYSFEIDKHLQTFALPPNMKFHYTRIINPQRACARGL